MVNFVTLCVFSEQFLTLKLDLAAIKAHIYTFCHIDSCKDDSLYYKAFPIN